MTEEIINAVERCKFITSDGICKNPINTKQKYCDEVPEDWCYYRQYTELKQENKELRDSKFKELDRALEAEDKYKSALEKIRDLCIHYENTNDKCITNCYAHFIVTDLIQSKIDDVLK
jgi:hypothetical protein